MRLNRVSFFISFLFLVVLAVSCKKSQKVPDVSKIHVQLKVLRFEKDLFSADPASLATSVPFFQKKYGEFFDMFNHKVINIGGPENPAYPDYLKGFVTDYDINSIKKAVDSVFHDFSPIQAQIQDMFKYYKYYFPEMPVPIVITYMSGFNQSMVSSDTILGIGLDKYLGRNSVFYSRMGLANFMKHNMFPGKIPSDCARAWAMTQFEQPAEASSLLDHMIYEGKIIYFTKCLMPYTADSLVTGFSNNQLNWCADNESGMWTYLIENKLLFKTDNQTIVKFVGDAPFTKGFGRNSPGKAAAWIGYRIVSKYMEQNNVELAALMKEYDFQKILRQSKYKP